MPKNLWDLGERVANNPSAWSRIKHSSKGTAIRRSLKKSTPFKVAASGVNYLLKQVPLPVIKDILAAASDAIYKAGKSWHRSKQKAGAASRQERVKFAWKDLDVKDMDRYRWKVQDAIKELNKAAENFNKEKEKYAENGKICESFIKVTAEYAYAKKRINKLKDKAMMIGTICTETTQWCNECEATVDSWATNHKAILSAVLATYNAEAHEQCDKTECCLTDDEKMRLKHENLVNAGTKVSSLVLNAVDPSAFVNFSSPSDHQIKMDNPWTGKNYSPPPSSSTP